MYNRKFLNSLFIAVFTGFFALCLRSAPAADTLDMTAMRFGAHGANATRVVMELNREADFRATVITAPPEDRPAITIDLPLLGVTPTIGRTVLPKLLRDIRIAPLPDGYSRITLILSAPATIRSAFLIPAAGKQAARLVVDLGAATQAAFAAAKDRPYGTLRIKPDTSADTLALAAPASVPAGALPFAAPGGARLEPIGKPDTPKIAAPEIAVPEIAVPEIAGVTPPPDPKNRPLVMIDAGHGGADPGASGAGVREKDVTLATAKALRTRLEKTGKYRVELTRERDLFIPLAQRVKIARNAGAALFISLHADSVPENGDKISGTSFYTLSQKASDAQTAALATRENNVDILGGVDIPSDDRDVAQILIDLTFRETAGASRRFSGDLVKSFGHDEMPLLFSPDRHAGFVVLKAPDIPSALIELGFLSNPDEAHKLADPAWREKLAGAIAGGIDAWFTGQGFAGQGGQQDVGSATPRP